MGAAILCAHTCINTDVFINMHVLVCRYIHNIHICMHINVNGHRYVYKHVFLHAYRYMYVNT